MKLKTWFITGCSTGIGRAVAEEVLKGGYNAVVTARDVSTVEELKQEYPDTALVLPLDVTERSQISEVVEKGLKHFGSIDVLINNAGYGYRAAVEEGEIEAVDKLFQTNFFGPIELIKEVLPNMRKNKYGAIANVSSIAAQKTAPGSGYYAASKSALESMTEGLLSEVSDLGIKVLTIEPGAFRTDFTGRSITQAKEAIPDYAKTAGLRRKENDKTHGTQPGSPEKAGKVIVDTILQPDCPTRLLLGSDAVEIVRQALNEKLKNIEEYEAISKETDY